MRKYNYMNNHVHLFYKKNQTFPFKKITHGYLEKNAGLLENVLEQFGIKGKIVNVNPGPVVTLYEFEPAPGIKSSRVIGLADDIARSMSSLSARVAVIPKRNAIGIELPQRQSRNCLFSPNNRISSLLLLQSRFSFVPWKNYWRRICYSRSCQNAPYPCSGNYWVWKICCYQYNDYVFALSSTP